MKAERYDLYAMLHPQQVKPESLLKSPRHYCIMEVHVSHCFQHVGPPNKTGV